MRPPQFKILASGLFPADQVLQAYDNTLQKDQFTPEHERQIDAAWTSVLSNAKSTGRNLFDAPLFRLDHCAITNGNLTLHYGDTTYRAYVATRSPDIDLPRADPIGTLVIPVTSDGYIPIGRRAASADVNPGRFFTFGGFFDRACDFAPGTTNPDIFTCIAREVREELAIDVPPASFQCLGVIYDLRHLHPEMSFTVNLDVEKSQIETSHWQSELADLSFVHHKSIGPFLDRFASETTDTLVGALQIFHEQITSREL